MLVQLTVRSKNFKSKTAYTESFDSERMKFVRANQNSGSVPALAGAAEFTYENDNARNDFYTVTETVAYITNATGGVGSPLNIGTAATGVTAVEYGDGVQHQTILTFDADWVKAVAGAALCFGVKIYDFPKGGIEIYGGAIKFTISAPTATNTPEVGIGHVIGDDSANATIGAAGATMESVLDGTATSAITSAGTDEAYGFDAETDATFMDGTSAAIDLFLNCAGNWAVSEDITFSDIEIQLTWAFLGEID